MYCNFLQNFCKIDDFQMKNCDIFPIFSHRLWVLIRTVLTITNNLPLRSETKKKPVLLYKIHLTVNAEVFT